LTPIFYLDEKGEELNRLNEKKEGAKYLSLSKLINEYARSHPRLRRSKFSNTGKLT
jgi:hypothetical protein